MDLGELQQRANERTCLECGESFKTNKEAMAMEQWADHIRVHQCTAEQWTKAYRMMQKNRKPVA